MTINKNSVVSIHYTLKDTEGEILDSSKGQEPLTYLHGAGNIIPGLENELTGKSTGDALKVTVQPEDGYGPVNENLIQTVPKSAFGEHQAIELGQRFTAGTDNGQEVSVAVVALHDDSVTVDGNHPLAGKVLNFEVAIESIRDASEEEIAHGHVHANGQHCSNH